MEPAPLMSGHVRGKERRRRQILDAARAIIVRAGEAGLTMRGMAAEAGVSPATPYNLFGSKQAVLEAIYDEDQAQFRAEFDAAASGDPLGRLFDMIDLGILHWQRAPGYYQALLAILYRGTGPGGASRLLDLTHLEALLGDAVAAGDLRRETPVGTVTAFIARMFRSVALEWIDGQLSLEQAHSDLGRSIALVLAGLVAEPRRATLADLQRRYDR